MSSSLACSRLADLLRDRRVSNVVANIKCVDIETAICREVDTTLAGKGVNAYGNALIVALRVALTATKKRY